MRFRERRDLVPPGAMRFGKAMEQDDRRVRRVAGESDVEIDARRQRNARKLDQG
jgi:hypothetical protein